MKENNVNIDTGNEGDDIVKSGYPILRADKIHCLYVPSKVALEVDAIGNGSHPNLMVTVSEKFGKSFPISFTDYGSMWDVFSATAEKSGIRVTLYQPEHS